MAATIYTVTTITELVNQLASLGSSSPTDILINVEPDNNENLLDFNNEDFYYHTGNFLTFGNIGGESTITIDFKDSTLTNIYVYPNSSFFYQNFQRASTYRTTVIKNGTFEMVLNKGYVATMLAAEYSNASMCKPKFYNCVFNLKVNGSSSYNTLFLINANLAEFVNCVFNIDMINGSNNSIIRTMPGTADDTGTVNLYINSCEFRIKLGDKTSLKSLVNFNKSSPVLYNINDNIVFFDYYFPYTSGDTKATIKHIESIYGWSLNASSSYSNNFFASLDTGKEIAIKLNQGDAKLVNGTTFFCDSEKIEGTAFPGTTCVSLTTAQCKDAAALAAAGYVCAVEG